MFRNLFSWTILLLGLVTLLALSACASFLRPVIQEGAAATPVVSYEGGGADNPDVYVDPDAFQAALLKALSEKDTNKLEMWMTTPFLTGAWRADLADSAPADAVEDLYANHLSADNDLSVVNGVDLPTLMGGKDPLSIPRGEAGVIAAFLVSGWGMDGLDEAVLFIARQPDNSLKWHGWMRIRGGFSGARLGGIQPYQNDAHGYSAFIPQEYRVSSQGVNTTVIVAPGEGHPGIAFIYVESANGRTAQQAVDAAIAAEGEGFNISVVEVLGIEDAEALVVNGFPGQDVNRQVYMVHGGILYHMVFSPADPQSGPAYRQMEDLYAVLINTFHFLE